MEGVIHIVKNDKLNFKGEQSLVNNNNNNKEKNLLLAVKAYMSSNINLFIYYKFMSRKINVCIQFFSATKRLFQNLNLDLQVTSQ